MKTLFASWLLVGGLVLGLTAIAQAQNATSTQPGSTASSTPNNYATATNNSYNSGAPGASNSSVRTLSGCLQQGAGANEYTLYGYNANSWELASNSVDLAAHVGQAVEIAYIPQPRENGANHPLIVTDLVMVSSSCEW